MSLKRWWSHSHVRDLNVEHIGSIESHRRMILDKPILRHTYEQWYRELKSHADGAGASEGPMIEVGCGAGFLNQWIPGLVATDVEPHAYADRVMDAQSMDLPDASVRCFFCVNVMHHFEDLGKFLEETSRCLKPGGRLVLVEPHNGPFTRFLFRWGEHSEHLDPHAAGWKNKGRTRMLEANNALPWIVFVRDRAEFDRRFPELKIVSIRQHTFLSYALSGGMSYRSFLPAFTLPLIDAIEWAARPWMKQLGTAMTVVVEKRQNDDRS
jgi:SAM-dependent methyltransferase